MRYAVELTPDPESGTVIVSVPDLPGVRTFGGDEAEARYHAIDAILTWLDADIVHGERIEPPPDVANRPFVTLPLLADAKIAIYRAMIDADLSPGQLAVRLGWTTHKVGQLLNLFEETSLHDIEAASTALGYEPAMSLSRAA